MAAADSKRSRLAMACLTVSFGVMRDVVYDSGVAVIHSGAVPGLFVRPLAGVPNRCFPRPCPMYSVHTQQPAPEAEDLYAQTTRHGFAVAACAVHAPCDAPPDPALPPHVRAAVEWIATLGDGISAWRLERTAVLEKVYESARPMSRIILQTCPEKLSWVGGSDPNPAFACMVIDALDIPCKEWPAMMYKFGFSIVGDAPSTGLWRPKTDKELQDSARTHDPKALPDSWQYTRRVMERMEERFSVAKAAATAGDTAGLVQANAAWDASVSEVNLKKSAFGPLTLEGLKKRFGNFGSKHGPRPVPRHAVDQGGKFRPVDNGSHREGLHNAAYMCREKVWLMPADFTAGVGRAFFDIYAERGEPCPEIVCSSDDEPNAYRNVPAAEPEYHVAIVVSPKSGRAMFFAMRGHAFGFAGSVGNYCQKSAIISITSALLLAAPVAPYIDDFTTPETAVSLGPEVPGAEGWHRFPGSAKAALRTIARLFGSPLTDDTAKTHTALQVSSACGVTTDLSRTHLTGEVRMRIKESTRLKALGLVASHRAAGSLRAADAATLTGKCGYILGLVHSGRAALRPISRRQYEDLSAITPAVGDAFTFLELFLNDAIMDAVLWGVDSPVNRITVFSDASWQPRPPLLRGAGIVAFIVFFPDGSSVTASGAVPQYVFDLFEERDTYITVLELMALCAVYFSLSAARYRGHRILHFGDNTGANFAAIKGYSTATDMNLMLGAYNLKLAQESVQPWVEYVPTELNIADLPTRPDDGEWSRVRAIIAPTEIPFVFPSLSSWGSW